MITVGRDGAVWRWLHRTPGMTWSSGESFATLPDAVDAGRTVAECKGEQFMEPEIVDIWMDAEPEPFDVILPTQECPPEYDADADAKAVDAFLASLQWAGVAV